MPFMIDIVSVDTVPEAVAVNVTDSPTIEGFREEVTEVGFGDLAITMGTLPVSSYTRCARMIASRVRVLFGYHQPTNQWIIAPVYARVQTTLFDIAINNSNKAVQVLCIQSLLQSSE
jgi:hypothetical protein